MANVDKKLPIFTANRQVILVTDLGGFWVPGSVENPASPRAMRLRRAYAQVNSIGVRTSGCRLLCTGQVWAARSSFCLSSGLREWGT